MTVAADAPPLRFARLEEALAALRAAGMRISTPRRLVLEALFEAEDPVSAMQLAQALTLDESSVYRNLELFERHGLVRHVHLGHGPGLYVLSNRPRAEYLFCEQCHRVTAVAPESLEPVRALIRDRFDHEARFTHFALIGRCARCQAATRATG